MPSRRIRRTSLALLPAVIALLPSPAAAYPRPGNTELVSLADDESLGNKPYETASEWPALTPDARLVAFHSSASNLVPGDTNQRADIFLRDRDLGTTTRISVASNGAQGSHDSWAPRITPDGRFIAFESWASSLWPGDAGWADVFVHDRQTGVTQRISNPVGDGNGDESSFGPAISDDGRWVAFDSDTTNMVAGDINGAADVFLYDRETATMRLVSVSAQGLQGDAFSGYASISADGRHVAYNSRASNLVLGDTNLTYDDFVFDSVTGTVERVSVASDGTQANNGGFGGKLSADARYFAFTSASSNLVPFDGNGSDWDVFVHDRATHETRRASVSSSGEGANGFSSMTAFSPDGRYVSFWSDADNLVAGDTNGQRDVFLHDLLTGTTELVSVTHDGAGGNEMSWGIGGITPGGLHVGFMSVASNVVPGDTNGGADVFVRDRGPALGVRTLSAAAASDAVAIGGEVTASGGQLASVTDAATDAGPGIGLGGDLTGASVVYRPERGDLLARLRLASLPSATQCATLAGCPSAAGAPGVLYGIELRAAGVRYEIRALRVAATAAPPATPFTGLYRCDPTCTEVARLAGAIGDTEREVLASVPLASLGVAEGATLTDVRAFTGAGEASTGSIQGFDEAPIGSMAVPRLTLDLGMAPEGVPADEVNFQSSPQLTGGRFAASLARPSAGGSHRVWGRVCLGEDCAFGSAALD